MKKPRKLPNRSRPQPSIWSRTWNFVKENSSKLFIGLLVITAGSAFYRRGSFFHNNEISSIPEPTSNIPPECNALYIYRANPQYQPGQSLSSYRAILLGTQHNTEGEKKAISCVNALAEKGDVAFIEAHERGKPIDCSVVGLNSKKLQCVGWEPPETSSVWDADGYLKTLKISIVEEFLGILKEHGPEGLELYLNMYEKVGSKEYFSKKEYSVLEYANMYKNDNENFMKNLYSKAASSINQRLRKGEKLASILNDIIYNELQPDADKKQNYNKDGASHIANRTISLANQVKEHPLSRSKNKSQSKGTLFTFAGMGHFAHNKRVTASIINEAVTELYETLDKFADQNPYAVLVQENSDFDLSNSMRLGS